MVPRSMSTAPHCVGFGASAPVRAARRAARAGQSLLPSYGEALKSPTSRSASACDNTGRIPSTARALSAATRSTTIATASAQ